jgi:hypothetical protein
MKRKSDTFNAFKVFKAYAENHFGRKIKVLQEDKGGEYMSRVFDNYLRSESIVRRHSTRNRPQQNGMAERGNRTVDEHTTAMLHEANLPPSFKALADAAYIHVTNMHPTSHIPENTTPYEKPDVSHLRVWGCLAYVYVQKDKRDTSGIHFQKCNFVGYPTEYKGWLFYNPVTRKMVTSERAVFDERYFPGNKPSLLQHIPRNPPSTFVDLPPKRDAILCGESPPKSHRVSTRGRFGAALRNGTSGACEIQGAVEPVERGQSTQHEGGHSRKSECNSECVQRYCQPCCP